MTFEGVTGFYPLSPLQEGLLFHSLAAPRSGMYFNQCQFTMRGQLNVDAFRRAWDEATKQHDILRTFFVWEGLKSPVQVVNREVTLPFELHDWQRYDDATQNEHLQSLLTDLRKAGFRLNQAPLMRLDLARTAADRHEFIWSFHHLLLDGWSMFQVLQEVFGRYEAFVVGRELHPPAPRPYRDFIAHLKRQDLGAAERYWKESLRGFEPAAPLIIDHGASRDRQAPDESEIEQDMEDVRLSPTTTAAIQALARRHRVTLNTVVQLGWALLLSRYSDTPDVVFGTVISGRPPELDGFETMVGLFINTLPVRVLVSPDDRVTQALTRLQRQQVESRQYEFSPLAQVQQWSGVSGDRPLFETLMLFENYRKERTIEEMTTSLQIENIRWFERTNYPLALVVIPETGLLFHLLYDRRFGRPFVQRMLEHLRQLVEGMADNPQSRLGDLPMLSAAERQQVLVAWNDTTTDYPKARCVHNLVEERAARAPEAVAVADDDYQLSYAELNARANQLAHHLTSLGVGPGMLVGLCMERSVDLVVGVLGILKAGAAYVPMDPTYPKERLAFMLSDTGAPVLLTQQAVVQYLPPFAGRTLCLDRDWPDISTQSQANPAPVVTSDALAYVIYTSGSTGRPKGVQIEHRSLCNLVYWHREAYEVTSADRATQIAAPAFDASVWELWPYLTAGASVHVPSAATRQDPEQLVSWLVAHRITLSFLPTPLGESVLRVRWPSDGALRAILIGGDRLTLRPEKNLPFRLINHYGPTENTVVATCAEVEATDALSADPPIGRPLPNTRAYVVDSTLRPVPIGVPGELLVGGAQLARGYLNRPDLTAERFIPDPFSGVHGARVYKTGDLVRYQPDGNIEFLGRLDDQVKIRGFRIELGEIEAVLVKHRSVRHAVVLAREDTPGDKRLVAYVVPAEATFDSEPVRAFVRAHLPDYMQPVAYVPLERVPLTPNGKVDRRALPAPEGASFAARPFEEPVGEIEVTLAKIWSDVLKLEQVSRHDHFFELGGHSLLVLSVLGRMRQAGLNADVRTLFVTPTLAELAAAVGGGGGNVEVPPNRIPPGSDTITPEMLPLVQLSAAEIECIEGTVPAGAANIQDIYPLAPLQEGMLFHHLMAAVGDPYLLYGLYGFANRTLLQRYLHALQSVIDRHDILRTAVVWEGLHEPVQVVWRQAPLIVDEVSLAATGGDVVDELRSRFDPRQYRLDVSRAPMMRVFIAHDAANDRWVMLHIFHHMSTDHTSLEVMQQEIRAHLLGQAGQLPAPLPFRNFVAQARLGISREEHTTFFRALLGDVNEPTTPFGLTDVHGDGTGITEAARLVEASLARRLRERARALGITAASLCHLAWAQVLARATGRDDVVFGTLVLGRMQGGSGADRVLGLFINTLPVRIRVGELGVQDGVRQTHTLLAQLLRHEHAPLALAQRCSAVAASAPLFSALLNCRRHSAAAGHLSSEAPQADDGIEFLGGEERSNYPLILAVDDMGEGFQLKAQVQSPVDPQRVCAFMHTALEQLVGALESAPATPLRDLDVMPAAERHQLLVAWNDTAIDYPRDRCIHQLFEAQSARAPEAVAVLDLDHQVTYGELNARANRLAHHLISLGVGPEVPVGICLERSTEFIVALLAILKSGGAYVPLDPGYPAERLAFMLSDSRAPVVLTVEGLLGQLPPFAGRIVCLDRDEAIIATQPETNPLSRSTAETLAYVMYTSGSTGTPKGVAVCHRNVIRLVVGADYARFDDQQTFLLLSAISFDASTFELWGALLHGARCAILRDRVPTIEVLGETLERYQVSTLWLTASLFNLIVDQAPQILRGVRQLLTGGEALSPAHIRSAQQRLPGVQLINGYGPTEGTTFTCCYAIPPLLEEVPLSIPIGRPIANTRVYVLDQYLRPVPEGVAGELYIGGDGVARGYLNHPELSGERFLHDPFAGGANARMYRTGDQARYLPDGNIEFVGRLDDQVKIRGYRIEPGEIEAVLAEHPAVGQAVVLAREDTPGDKRLVAYVVPADGSAADFEPLRAFLRERLPEYMRPAFYVRLEHLPLTANGKVDRRALPAPDAVTRVEGGGIVWPGNPTENQLVQIWEDLLNVRPIGVTDNFFEIGGHSLLAVRMMHEVERTCGRRLPLLTLFEGATIRQLGRALLGRTAESPAAALTAIHSGGSRRPFFFLHGDFNGGGFYSVALARELGPEQPFYALHPHGLDGRPMRGSIEEMADDHLATLRAVQPNGPYLLGGHCNGGLIALDIARRLRAEGERVDLVAVLDTWVQAPGSRPPAWDEDSAQQAATPLGEAYQRAISAYVPERFPAPVALFYSGTEPDTEFEVTWQAVAEDLRVFRIPGNHLDFITRDVHILGALLRSCLDAGA